MNVINRIRYRGWLAPGIVLNAVVDGDVLFVPNTSRDGSLFSLNTAKFQAVQLSGRVLSACWMIPLINYAYQEVHSGTYAIHEGFVHLNPFADPCVLAAPCLFDGEIQVISGNDITRVSFNLPPAFYDDDAKYAMTEPILPALYIPNSVGTAVLAGVDEDSDYMEALTRTWGYLPVKLTEDSPALPLYGMTTIAPFVALQRHDLNLAGLVSITRGTPRTNWYYLKVRLRQPVSVDDHSVSTVLIGLKSMSTLTGSIASPRRIQDVFDFFSVQRSFPTFSHYLVPGTRQVTGGDAELDSVLTLV